MGTSLPNNNKACCTNKTDDSLKGGSNRRDMSDQWGIRNRALLLSGTSETVNPSKPKGIF